MLCLCDVFGIVVDLFVLIDFRLKTKWWDSVVKCQNPKFYVIHPSEQKVRCLEM